MKKLAALPARTKKALAVIPLCSMLFFSAAHSADADQFPRNRLLVTGRIWNPDQSEQTAFFSIVNVKLALAMQLEKIEAQSINSAANAEVNGAGGMNVQSVSYDYLSSADNTVNWSVLTSDGVNHSVIVGNAEGQSGMGNTMDLGNGWVRRTYGPEKFMPPITATETIANAGTPDTGYNAPEFAGPVASVELVYNSGTSNGGTGKAVIKNIRINDQPAIFNLRAPNNTFKFSKWW